MRNNADGRIARERRSRLAMVRFALSRWPVIRYPNRSRNHVHRARLRPVISRLLGEADLSAGCEIVKRTA